MRELELRIDRSPFNLLWVALHAREDQLLKSVEVHGDDSDEGADALNDLAALRLYRLELRELAEKVFDANAFIVEGQSH